MNTIPHANRQELTNFLPTCAFGLMVLIVGAGLAAPPVSIAAPKSSGAQKTEKECKNDRTNCEKNCDQLIDIGDAIKRCKDRCTDAWINCLPLRSSQPGGKIGGMRHSVLPEKNAPIMRRGVEGEQTGEPAPEQPEQLEQGTETK